MVFASVVRGALRGMPLRVVASYPAIYMDSSTHLLIARPEYKSLKELKGKPSPSALMEPLPMWRRA